MLIKNEIYLRDLFDNNINSKLDRLKNIAFRAHEQRMLRVKAEIFIQKWHEFKVAFKFNKDEISISN